MINLVSPPPLRLIPMGASAASVAGVWDNNIQKHRARSRRTVNRQSMGDHSTNLATAALFTFLTHEI